MTPLPTSEEDQGRGKEDTNPSSRPLIPSAPHPALRQRKGGELLPCPSCSRMDAPARLGATAAYSAHECAYYAEDRLFHFHELPPVLQFNRWVRSGYRAGLSYRQCMRSLLQHHNETGNILTHALPLVFILFALAWGLANPWEGAKLEYYANIIAIAACFLGSVAYHLFSANHHCYHLWLGLDVCGILLVLVGAGHLILWWGLHCHPTLRALFCAAYYVAAAAAVYCALRADTALKRGLPLLLLLGIRVASFVARLCLLPVRGGGVRHFLGMEVLCLIGGVINAARVPERWLQPKNPLQPAPLDYWLNSHQLMHVLVVAAMFMLHAGAEADYHMVTALSTGALQCRPGR